MASSRSPPISLQSLPPVVHIIGRSSSADIDFDPATFVGSEGDHAPRPSHVRRDTGDSTASGGGGASGLKRKDSLESTRSFYNITVSSSTQVGRQSPTPSHQSYHRPTSRQSAYSLTSPTSNTSALPNPPPPGRTQQSAFTSGVLPARGFFAPQRPGDARREQGELNASTSSRFDPKPSASQTSFGYSSRQPSEEGSVAPLDPLQRVGGPGAVAYKGSREPLLDSLPVTRGGLGDSPRHANGSMGGSPKLNFGGSPGLTFGLGDGSKKGSPAASKAGSPYLAQQPSTPPATARLPASKRDIEEGNTKRVRAYELHDSSNAFALGGRLITGGDASPLPMLLTFVLEIGLSAAWIGTTGVGLWRHGVSGNGDNGGIAVVVVFLWLWGISFGAMIATAFRDPGILPRNLDPSPPMAPTRSTNSLVPLPRELRVRAGRVTVKYCDSCRIYRPPRASHCRICDNCVDGIDHHCAYLHTCVGRNNYTSFLACLFFTVLSLVYMIVWSAVFLWRTSASQGKTFGRALGDEAGSGVVFVLEVLMLMPVGSLMSYHFWLMLNNSTTIEEIRRTAARKLNAPPSKFHKLLPCLATVRPHSKRDEDENPYSFGVWWRNFGRGVCRPRVGSWMGFSEWREVSVQERGEREK